MWIWATQPAGLHIVWFLFSKKFKPFWALFIYPLPQFNQTENPVNIKSIINIYNPHTLKIPSITKMWMISRRVRVWFACCTKPQRAKPPFCFRVHTPACSQRRLNIEVLFWLSIDVFFLSPSTRVSKHSARRGGIDAQCWWRFIIEKEIVSIWLEFVMGSFVLIIYIAGHLCQSALWDPFLLSVCV